MRLKGGTTGNSCCDCEIPTGTKYVAAIAWWPGFLPFTLDGSTPNTTKFMATDGTPYSATKYLAYSYSGESEIVQTDVEPNVTTTKSVSITLVFDATYGDLVSASYSETDAGPGGEDLSLEWARGDGLFSESECADYIISSGDLAVPWPTSASKMQLRQALGPGALDNTYAMIPLSTLTATAASGASSGSWSHDGHDYTYAYTVSASLSSARTHATAAAAAETLLAEQTLSTTEASVSGVLTENFDWTAPSGSLETYYFGFTNQAQQRIDDSQDATNMVTLCKNRYVSGTLKLLGNGGLPLQNSYGRLSAKGVWNPFSAIVDNSGDWWDEPQQTLGILAMKSMIYLPNGLDCDNAGDAVPYDFETIWPLDDGVRDTPVVGAESLAVGTHTFDPATVEDSLPAGSLYGDGWIGYFPGTRPAGCP